MARLNLEDELHTDNRFFDLCFKLGSRRVAYGALVEAWYLAQKFVTPENEDGAIPIEEWRSQRIADEIIDVRLATVSDGLVHITGGKKHFAWLVQRQLAARKGGEANKRRIEAEKTGGEPNEAEIEPGGAGRLPAGSPLTLTLPLSSFSFSEGKTRARPRAEPPPPPDLGQLWNEHCGELPKTQKISKARQTQWNARWRDKPDGDYWVAIVQRLAQSAFCLGDNDRGWRADVDFLLRPDTHLKASEGKYDHGGSRRKTHTEHALDANAALRDALVGV